MKKVDGSIKLLIGCIVAVAVLVMCLIMSNRGQSVDELVYHKVAVDSQMTGDLQVLDEAVEGKEIIFTAEFHGVKANMQLELKFLKYLKEKTNFKYYLCELSHAQALSLNKFLETGDTAILDEMYEHYRGTYAYTKDNYNRWVELYTYNQQFDVKDQIRVVGVDVEHQVTYALSVVKSLLPVEKPPVDLEETIQTLQEGREERETLSQIHKAFMAKEEAYKAYLGEKYFDIEMILRNINNLYDVNEDMNLFNARRDAVMYENFMAIYETLEPDIFYGQWGHNHTYQSEEGGVKWFAAALAESIFKDKILTIAYTYDDCEYMSKEKNGTYGVREMDTFSGYRVKEGDAQTALLFSVKESGAFLKEYERYYQYLLLIRDAKATEPYGE